LVTISEVQDYMRTKESDDPIPIKSVSRVTRSLAESIKATTPLDGGRCNFCSRHTTRLVPVTMNVCLSCAKKLMTTGGGIKIIKTEQKEFYCDYCLSRGFKAIYINPQICGYCAKRIGRTHKFQRPDMKREQQKQEKRKQVYKTGGQPR